MDLSGAAIERKTFDIVKKVGYDPDQVTSYLQRVAEAMDRAELKIKDAELRRRQAEEQVLKAREEAKAATESFVAVAEIKHLLLSEAQGRAREILAEAYEGVDELDTDAIADRVSEEVSELARAVFAGVVGETQADVFMAGSPDAAAPAAHLLEDAREEAARIKAEARALLQQAETLMNDLQQRPPQSEEAASEQAALIVDEAKERAANLVLKAREEVGILLTEVHEEAAAELARAREEGDAALEQAKADAARIEATARAEAEAALERVREQVDTIMAATDGDTPTETAELVASLTAIREEATALLESAVADAALLVEESRAEAEREAEEILARAREEAALLEAASPQGAETTDRMARIAAEVAEMRRDAAAHLEEARAEAAGIVARADDEALDIVQRAHRDAALVSSGDERRAVEAMIESARAEAARVIADADQEAAAILDRARGESRNVDAPGDENGGGLGEASGALQQVAAVRARVAETAVGTVAEISSAGEDIRALLARVRRMEASGREGRRAAMLEELARLRTLVEGLDARLHGEAAGAGSRVVIDLRLQGTHGGPAVATFYTDRERATRYESRSAHLPQLGDDLQGLRESVDSLRRNMPDMGK